MLPSLSRLALCRTGAPSEDEPSVGNVHDRLQRQVEECNEKLNDMIDHNKGRFRMLEKKQADEALEKMELLEEIKTHQKLAKGWHAKFEDLQRELGEAERKFNEAKLVEARKDRNYASKLAEIRTHHKLTEEWRAKFEDLQRELGEAERKFNEAKLVEARKDRNHASKLADAQKDVADCEEKLVSLDDKYTKRVADMLQLAAQVLDQHAHLADIDPA